MSRRIIMKKLLLGIILLGSLSSYATTTVKGHDGLSRMKQALILDLKDATLNCGPLADKYMQNTTIKSFIRFIENDESKIEMADGGEPAIIIKNAPLDSDRSEMKISLTNDKKRTVRFKLTREYLEITKVNKTDLENPVFEIITKVVDTADEYCMINH
jgi:hypothetical protein